MMMVRMMKIKIQMKRKIAGEKENTHIYKTQDSPMI